MSGRVAAEHVGHHRDRRGQRGEPSGRSRTARRCCSNCEVPAPSMPPVPGVVRPHGQLVDQQAARRLEQLDGQHPGDAELFGQAQRELAAPRPPRPGDGPAPGRSPRGRCRPAARSRPPGTRRPGRAGSARQHRQLPVEVDVLLGEQPADPPGAPSQHRLGLRRRLADPHAPAVVAAADRLEHHRPARPRRTRSRRPRSATARPRAGHASPVSRSPHTQLVLGHQRGRARPDRHAGVGQRGQMSAGTCSWSKVSTSQPAAKASSSSTTVVADRPCPGPHQGRGVVGPRRQHAQLHAQARSPPAASCGPAARRPTMPTTGGAQLASGRGSDRAWPTGEPVTHRTLRDRPARGVPGRAARDRSVDQDLVFSGGRAQ